MFVALFALLFLGGGGSSILLDNIDMYEDRAKTVIIEKDRLHDAENVLKSVEKRTEKQGKDLSNTLEQLGDLLEDSKATDQQLDAVWDQFLQEVSVYQHDIIDLRFELKRHVNQEEWAAIFAQNDQK